MASVARVFVAPHTIHGSTIRLKTPADRHYLTRVRRLKAGDAIECFDGTGRTYRGSIVRIGRASLEIAVERQWQQAALPLHLTLAQALPKGDRFEWIIQKATELGVGHIVPLMTRHTVVQCDPTRGARKHQRWQRIIAEAAKQCGRASVPQIEAPQSFRVFIPSIAKASLALIPTLAAPTRPLDDVVRRSATARDITILIGPEGDFHQEEIHLAQSYGAQAVSLGPLTLRAETAALATTVILQYLWRSREDKDT